MKQRPSGERLRLQAFKTVLPLNTLLVDYLKFNYFPPSTGEAIPHYVAVVVDKSGLKSLKDLGPADIIDKVIERYRAHMTKISQRGDPISDQEVSEYANIARGMYNLIWRPIENTVKS